MKFYIAEMTITVVVAGDDIEDAYDKIKASGSDIRSYEEFDITVTEEADINNLPFGWDLDCVPYGLDGNTRLRDVK